MSLPVWRIKLESDLVSFHHLAQPDQLVAHQMRRRWPHFGKIEILASATKRYDIAVHVSHAVSFVGLYHEVILAEELVKEERRTHVQVPVVAYPIVYHKCQCCAAKSKAADHDEDVMMSEKFLLVIHLT